MSSSERPPRDVGELVERLARLHRTASARGRFERLELYSRASLGIRVELDTECELFSTTLGSDEGTAVRVQARRGGGVGFAATTGADQSAIDWALAEAQAGIGATVSSGEPWSPEEASQIRDTDATELPDPEAVESWLQRAWRELCRAETGPFRWTEGTGRVEVARILEAWVTDRGLHASRSRTRAWAVARTRRGKSAPVLRSPLFVASRDWRALEVPRWSELWAARGGSSGSGPPSSRHCPLLLTPEISAGLVAALVRAVHGPGNPVGVRVGPAWQLVDDPLAKGAIQGGVFDDCGFPTARRVLADGETTVGLIAGPGTMRRASFRDPPAPFPSQLRVDAAPEAAPPNAALVSGLTIHPQLSGDWVVELAGPVLGSGFFRISPLELARKCVAAVGVPETDHRGVTTPSLLLEDVEVLLRGV